MLGVDIKPALAGERNSSASASWGKHPRTGLAHRQQLKWRGEVIGRRRSSATQTLIRHAALSRTISAASLCMRRFLLMRLVIAVTAEPPTHGSK